MHAGRQELLKRDVFGTVSRITLLNGRRQIVERDTRAARWWARGVARTLAAREARSLRALRAVDGVPELLDWSEGRLHRSWLAGRPMQQAKPADPAYFREALRLLRRMHAAGIVHNDLAKEPNWLVTPAGQPAVVDFQLSAMPRFRGRLFRALAYDDLRHLLKHKRSYCGDRLTARQRRILERPSPLSAGWARSGKPVYRFITRRLLGWADREGAGDRHLP
jgi:RIO-like serine/threonine protein kinase